jgi:hypothetical protein
MVYYNQFVGRSYSQDGFTFTSSVDSIHALTIMNIFDPPFDPVPGDLGTYMGGSVTIAKTSGAAFEFDSIDLSDLYGNYKDNTYNYGNIDFTFNNADGTQTTAVVALNMTGKALGLQTASFLNITDVTSVVMQADGTPVNSFQFNNLNYSAASTGTGDGGGITSTPELPSPLMAGLGMLAMAFFGWRRKAST